MFFNSIRKCTLLTGIAFLFVFNACGSEKEYPLAPDIPLDVLQEAPESIDLKDREYHLEAYLWRDFMPISPPQGKPLIALIRLVEQSEREIPGDLGMEYLWVINGQQIWATTFSNEKLPPHPKHELHRIARNGPKWGPHIEVDVIVGLKRDDGHLELLKAPDQWINRTD